MFVSFEGCEGVGKSTQLRYLKDYLSRTEQSALVLREPGSTVISEQIRDVILDPNNVEMTPETESLLYAAARVQLIKQKIMPALKRGELVICDRYIDSSVAYQGYARGLGADFVKTINAYAERNCMPDLTVFIDLSPSESWRSQRGEDRMEQETANFHKAVYEGYKSEIALSNGRIVPIKPSFDKIETHESILALLRERGIIK